MCLIFVISLKEISVHLYTWKTNQDNLKLKTKLKIHLKIGSLTFEC